jgi:quinol monooxygenase YgiN
MFMSTAIAWNLQVALRAGQLEAFRSLMLEMVESTRAEPGVQAYDWYLSEDGSACHIHERYRDDEAAMAHIGTFGSTFAERFLACAEPTALHVHGDPGASVREALDGFGAVYFGSFGGLAGSR